MNCVKLLLVSFIVFSSVWLTIARAQDGPVVNLSTTVTGNQEQPKVLYIVPWQEAEDNTLLYEALNRNTSDTVFGHVERNEHKREIEFLSELEQE